MYCSKCGKQNEESAVYCNFCGEPLNRETVVLPSPEKKDFSNRLRFTFSAVIGFAFFYVFGLLAQRVFASFGDEAIAGFLITIGLCRLFVLFIHAFAGIPVMVQDNRCKNASFTVALILELSALIAFISLAPLIAKLYTPNPPISTVTALRWTALVGFIITVPLIPLGYASKTNRLWKDVIFYAAAFTLGIIALLICYNLLHLNPGITAGIVLGIFFPVLALVPCARKNQH